MSEENRNVLELIQMAFKLERRKWAPIFTILSLLMTGGATVGASYIRWHDSNRDSMAHEVEQDKEIVAVRSEVTQIKLDVARLSSDVKLLVRSMQDDQTNAKEFREFVRERLK
jgi:hypothetical protein